MNADDLRFWQKEMGFTYDTAADALGISRATYANLVGGWSNTTKRPTRIDKRTALACAAIKAGIEPYHQ